MSCVFCHVHKIHCCRCQCRSSINHRYYFVFKSFHFIIRQNETFIFSVFDALDVCISFFPPLLNLTPFAETLKQDKIEPFWIVALNTSFSLLKVVVLPFSLLSSFKECLECVTRPKWVSFLAVVPTPIRETLLSLISAARQDSLINEFYHTIGECF